MSLHHGYAKAIQDEMLRQAHKTPPPRRASKGPGGPQPRLVSLLITGTAFLSGLGVGWIVS